MKNLYKTAAALLAATRMRQWIKNSFLFAPLIFAEKLTDAGCVYKIILGFISFCFLSAATYLFNDICDKDRDLLHPIKKLRPIASGAIGVALAGMSGLFFVILGLLIAFFLDWPFATTAIVYVILQIGYSMVLKHIVIIDIFSIAAGFVLRVLAGAFAITVPASAWLILCTMLLALFFTLTKRRHEYVLLGEEAQGHRNTLIQYSSGLLDQMIGVVTPAIIISYALYTMAPETIARIGGADLLYTVPFVLYGIFRYLYLVHTRQAGGEPERTLLGDWPLLLNGLAYGITVVLLIYFNKN